MTKTASILISLALSSSAFAGTAMVGKSKAVAPAPAPAIDCPCLLSYNSVEAGWLKADVDNVGSSNGGYAEAYYNVAPGFFADVSATFLSGKLDSDAYTIGAGAYYEVTKCVHLVGRAGYSYYDGKEGSEGSLYIAPGIRAQIGCNLELYAKVYFDFQDEETRSSYGVGAVWHFNQNVGLNVGYGWSEDSSAVQAGLRYQW
jgi:hypothetical protein